MSASTFCPNCGRPVSPGQRFCVTCGFALPAAPGVPPTAPVGGVPGAAAPPPSPPPGYAPPVAGYPPSYPGGYPPPSGAPYAAAYAPPPRQANFSNMFSGMFEVWTKNFVPLFLVYLIISLISGAVGIVGAILLLGIPFVGTGLGGISFSVPSSSNVVMFVLWEVLANIFVLLLTSAILGGVTDFAVRQYRGERVRIQDSLTRGFQRLLSVLGANLLVTLITVVVILVPLAVLIAGAFTLGAGFTGAGVAMVCGALIALPLLGVLVIYIAIALSLYAPAIMMEGAHAVDSLGRSWNLTKGHKWSIFAAGLVVGIIAVVIGGAIGFVAGLTLNPIVEVIVAAISAGITGSWFTILASVAYDLIVRTPQPTVWPPTYTPGPYPPGPSPPPPS